MNEIMSKEAALTLLQTENNIIFIDHLIGRLYKAVYKYNPDLNDKFYSNISSFQWVDSIKAFKLHFFDINRFIKIANQFGYFVVYSQEAYNSFCANKSILDEIVKLKNEIVLQMPPTKRELKKYQIIGAQFMYYARTVINADVPGAGKTIQTITAILLNKYADREYKSLIIAPNSVKYNWENEFALTTDELKVMVMDSNYNNRLKQYEKAQEYDALIMSYDSFLRDYEDIPSIFNPNILIIDEAHRLANRTNKITQILIGSRYIKKNFLRLCKTLHSIYLLTGTPFINKIDDIYPLFRIVDNGIYTLNGFRKRYMRIRECEKIINKDGYSKTIKFPIILGYKNEDEIKNRLNFYMIRRTKDKILNELPQIIFKTVSVELSPEELSIYNKIKENFQNEVKSMVGLKLNLNINNPQILKWFLKAQLACDSLELLEDSNSNKSSKKEELMEIIEDRIENNKIVIFSKYKKMIEILERDLKKYNPLVLHGDIKDIDRQENIELFRNDPNRRIFLATLGAGGVGVNLTTNEDMMLILYDRWYSAALNNQAISRVYRLGQNKPIEVIIMRVKNSIEERIEKIWVNKQITSINLIDDDAVFKMLSFEQLMELI